MLLFPLFVCAEEATLPVIKEIPCSERIVFGQTIGASRIKGKVELRSPNKTSLLMDSRFQVAGFGSIEVLTTPKTKRVVGASGAIGLAGEENMLKLRDSIQKNIEASFTITETKNNTLKSSITFYTGSEKSCTGNICYHSDGMQIELSTTDNFSQGLHGVYLSCTDIALQNIQFKEAMQN